MTTPTVFRKRPVEITALQFTRDNFRAAVDFVPVEQLSGAGEWNDGSVFMDIRTLEGVMHVSEGDWIIRGVEGEHYACKDEIFAKTYEQVTP